MVTPSVSVVMGIYNCAPYLQAALDSLYNQTYQDFEIILCDDGSSDDTYIIASENARTHKNIVLLKNETNKGLNYTLNRCLKWVRGKYIARMDGDDISLPERFHKEVEFLDMNPQYSIVSTPMFYFDEHGDYMVGKGGREPQKRDFMIGSPFCHAPCMVRREAYLRVNGYSENEIFHRVEDYHLWFKMYSLGLKGYILDIPLYKMRDSREAQKRRTLKNRINEARLKILILRGFSLPFWMSIYVLKPFLSLFLPAFIFSRVRRIGRKL